MYYSIGKVAIATGIAISTLRYYDTAIAAGSEETVKNLPVDEIPEDVRDYKL